MQYKTPSFCSRSMRMRWLLSGKEYFLSLFVKTWYCYCPNLFFVSPWVVHTLSNHWILFGQEVSIQVTCWRRRQRWHWVVPLLLMLLQGQLGFHWLEASEKAVMPGEGLPLHRAVTGVWTRGREEIGLEWNRSLLCLYGRWEWTDHTQIDLLMFEATTSSGCQWVPKLSKRQLQLSSLRHITIHNTEIWSFDSG